MPFRNQSQEPTLSGGRVSMAYYNELQSVPGFEVVPFGVVENQLAFFESQVLRRPIGTAEDFQQFAKHLGVDAVLQGAITDYDQYYPPRMTLKVNWYAANPGLHPIPVGYGLPWGTKAEKKIPSWIRLESERALAREQIATQTPLEDEQSDQETTAAPGPVDVKATPSNPSTAPSTEPPIRREVQQRVEPYDSQPTPPSDTVALQSKSRVAFARIQLPIMPSESVIPASWQESMESPNIEENSEEESIPTANGKEMVGVEMEEPERIPPKVTSLQNQSPIVLNQDGSFTQSPETIGESLSIEQAEGEEVVELTASVASNLPPDWPDPSGFIPPRPGVQRPTMQAQHEPVISHMKAYNGNDEDFTQSLQEYYYFRDDARFGGWQSYLQRSEDFIRFCCHRHIVETLSSRGGQLESRMNLRWPIGRYER
ncbi:MAG: hypothetical protein ACK56W_14125 [Pirellula sp.]|jgi:hypothetical protein|nr:hypothetical protein [Pirellula sp.]